MCLDFINEGGEVASITTNKKTGAKRLQFIGMDGKRRAIHLGDESDTVAGDIKAQVERILEAQEAGRELRPVTLEWLKDQSPKLLTKLVKAKLIPKPEEQQVSTLGKFLDTYLESRADLKPATKLVRGHVVRNLKRHLGEDRDVRTIEHGDADSFKQYLIKRGLAPTTVHKRLQIARWFFHAMRRQKLISENPFDGVRAVATGIADRQRFISRGDVAKVLEACPDHHWRAIVVLSRYGGMRCPSEVLSLRWEDVDFAGDRILVRSPKTAHHLDKAQRTIPLFPELRQPLMESWEAAPEGAEYVVDESFRKAAVSDSGWLNINLRTQFERIVRRAGLEPWPRPFHNMRASRETELVEEFPIQVVTAWLGNSPKVALRHYLMTTEAHFAAAVAKTAHETAQNTPAEAGTASPVRSEAHQKPRPKPGCSIACDPVQRRRMAEVGLEPTTRGL